jgi:hypothetical protein
MRFNSSLKIVIFILLLVFLATFLIHKINFSTDDLGRHIKTGEIIWQTKSVPKVNLFSYAEPDHLFINHHWLSELIFYGLYSLGGFSALIVLKVIILLLSFGIVYYLATQRGGFWWATVFAFLSILVFIERTDVRPEIFSYLMVALYLLIFYLFSSGKSKRVIWWLIPLELIWVNLHIYFFLGPFLVLVFFIQQLITYQKRGWWSNLKNLLRERQKSGLFACFLLTLFCFLVLLINPNFIKGATYPLFVLKNYGYDIVENKSPFYLDNLMDNPVFLHFKILIGLIIFSFILNHRRMNFFDFVTASFAVFLGCFALRNFPLTSLLALPVLAVNFNQGSANFFDWLAAKLDSNLIYLEMILCLVLIVFLLLLSYANFKSESKFTFIKNEWGIGLTEGSEAAAEFYLEHKIQGPVFNNFDIGSYLDFYLYPTQQTFVDNRPEAFSPQFWQYVYIAAQDDEAWWRIFDAHYNFNSIFMAETDATGWSRSFINRIIQDEDWVTVYLDKYAIILVKNIEKNKPIIDSLAIAPDEVYNKLNQYQTERLKVDAEMQEQRLKGFEYIRQNFGPVGSL